MSLTDNSTATPRLHLTKPAQTDTYDIDIFNFNADIIDDKLAKRATTRTAGNLVQHDTNGDLADAGKAVGDLIPKPATATSGRVAVFDTSKNVIDGGKLLSSLATVASVESLTTRINNFVSNYAFATDSVTVPTNGSSNFNIAFGNDKKRTSSNYAAVFEIISNNDNNGQGTGGACVAIISSKTETGISGKIMSERDHGEGGLITFRFYVVGGIGF